MLSPGLQGSLFDDAASGGVGEPVIGAPVIGELGSRVHRRELAEDAWVDVLPGWIRNADNIFDELRDTLGWQHEQRAMYRRVLDVPRLVSFHDGIAPHPLLREAGAALNTNYRSELPEGFATTGLCLYRDGEDSVAWHGDRFGRGATDDTLVAIVSFGATRPLLLRPRGGGPSMKFTVAHGDLFVMGGSCQRTWDHSIPKRTGVGPRISVQFRPRGVR